MGVPASIVEARGPQRRTRAGGDRYMDMREGLTTRRRLWRNPHNCHLSVFRGRNTGPSQSASNMGGFALAGTTYMSLLFILHRKQRVIGLEQTGSLMLPGKLLFDSFAPIPAHCRALLRIGKQLNNLVREIERVIARRIERGMLRGHPSLHKIELNDGPLKGHILQNSCSSWTYHSCR